MIKIYYNNQFNNIQVKTLKHDKKLNHEVKLLEQSKCKILAIQYSERRYNDYGYID